MDFVEEVSDLMDRSLQHFKVGEPLGAVRSLEHAVVLCESNPSFAFRQHPEVGSMQQVVEDCLQSATKRSDVGANLVALLMRMRARFADRDCTDGSKNGVVRVVR
jgi:hypothetical protein